MGEILSNLQGMDNSYVNKIAPMLIKRANEKKNKLPTSFYEEDIILIPKFNFKKKLQKKPQ